MSTPACTVVLALFQFLALIPVSLGQAHNASSANPKADFATVSAQADAARDADRLEEAESLYKKALAINPNWPDGWWSLGTIAYDRNAYADADKAFQKTTALVPNNGNAYIMLGLTEFELGRDSSSLAHLDKGMQLGINEDADLRHVALYHRGVLLQRVGKFQSAEATLEQLCLQGVRSDQAVMTLGMVLLRMPNRQPPIAGSLETDVTEHVGRAGCMAGQKKFDESKSELNIVVSRYPEYPRIHYAYGIVLLEASDVEGAEAQFKEEIKNSPSDVVSRLQIAAATYKTNSAAGLLYAEEAVKLAPHEPFAHYLMGLLLLDTDDYQRAIPELEIAEKAFPKESRIYLALGTAYSRAGRRQDASRARATFTSLALEKKKSASEVNEDSPLQNEDKLRVGDLSAAPQ